MFAGKCVPYVYSISVFINKQKRKWIKTMSLKYASIDQITPIFLNVHRKHNPEPPWQAYVWLVAHVQGGGAKGPAPPPSLEIEKQKKSHQSNFKLFHLYFATFLVGYIILSAIF